MTDSIMSSWAGSVAVSARPAFPCTDATSGNRMMMRSCGDQRPPGLFNRDPRKRGRHHEERALIERRHELGAEPLKHGHGRDHEQHRRRDHEDPESHDQHRNRPVDRAQDPADGIGRLGTESSPQQEHHQRRREGDGENRGGEHREGLRVRERREQLARPGRPA